MNVKNIVKAVTASTIDSATISAIAYTAVDPLGMPQSCFWIYILNASNASVDISYDGVHLHDHILANGRLDLKVQGQNSPQSQVCIWSKGTVVYVQGAPGVGEIIVGGYYQPLAST